MNTERSQAPGWNACPCAMADVLWDKQALTPFCPGGKDLMVTRQSLWWISSALDSFCILLKLKAPEDSLLRGLWSFPSSSSRCIKVCGVPQTCLGIVGSLLVGGGQCHEELWCIRASAMAWANRCCKHKGSWLKPAVRERKSCKKSWPCAVESEQTDE